MMAQYTYTREMIAHHESAGRTSRAAELWEAYHRNFVWQQEARMARFLDTLDLMEMENA
jgi:hypothetical protein